jgi:hypothetical protein
MERSAVVCIILAVTFVALAMFSYFYEPRSTGLLPVTTYPLRPYTIPFVIIGAIIASCGIRMAWADGKRRLVYNILGAPGGGREKAREILSVRFLHREPRRSDK